MITVTFTVLTAKRGIMVFFKPNVKKTTTPDIQLGSENIIVVNNVLSPFRISTSRVITDAAKTRRSSRLEKVAGALQRKISDLG